MTEKNKVKLLETIELVDKYNSSPEDLKFAAEKSAEDLSHMYGWKVTYVGEPEISSIQTDEGTMHFYPVYGFDVIDETHKIKDKKHKVQRAKSRRAQLRQAHKATAIWKRCWLDQIRLQGADLTKLREEQELASEMINKYYTEKFKFKISLLLLSTSVLINLGLILYSKFGK